MKKLGSLLCLSSALLISSVAHAAWSGNWLVGVSGGYADLEGHLNMTLEESPLPGVQTNFRGDFGDTGFIGGIFGGYQAICDRLLLGLELNVAWQDTDETQNFNFRDATGDGWAANMRYKRDTIVGLSGRLGLKASNCFMPYVRIGVQTSRDTLSLDALTDPASLAYAVDGSHRVYNLFGGLGVEMPMPRVASLSLRAEYDYTARGRRAQALGNLVNNNGVNTLEFVSADFRPHVNSGQLSVVWNFG